MGGREGIGFSIFGAYWQHPSSFCLLLDLYKNAQSTRCCLSTVIRKFNNDKQLVIISEL